MKKKFQASAMSLVCAVALGAAHAQSSGQGNTGANKQAATSTTPKQQTPATAVLLLVPVNMAGENLANGCWVRFHDGADYRGASLTLADPVDLPKIARVLCSS